MFILTAIGIIIGLILVFFAAPYWYYKESHGNHTNNVAWELTKGFIIEVSKGVIRSITVVFYYCLVRLVLGLIIRPLGNGSSKEYGIVILSVFSLSVVYAIYSTLYFIVMMLKHPGFKTYYLNNKSTLNMGKDNVDDQHKKRRFSISRIVTPQKPKRLVIGYFYDILGIDQSANTDDVIQAYREKAQQYNPDNYINASKQERDFAEEKFSEIKDAYEHIMKLKKGDKS